MVDTPIGVLLFVRSARPSVVVEDFKFPSRAPLFVLKIGRSIDNWSMKVSSLLASVFTGIFLGAAWWVYADGVIDFRHTHTKAEYAGHWVVPGLLALAGAVGMNLGVTPQMVHDHWGVRLWMFLCCVCVFVAIGLAVWITVDGGGQWAAASIVVQSVCMLVAGLLFFFRNGISVDQHYSL